MFVEIKNSAEILNSFGALLRRTCKYDAAIEKLELCGKIHYVLGGSESSEYAAAVSNLANVLADSNHDETALVWYEIAHKIYQKRFGNDHEECATSHHNISSCLHSLKRYDEARLRIEQAIRIYERVYGTAHVEVAGSLVVVAISKFRCC